MGHPNPQDGWLTQTEKKPPTRHGFASKTAEHSYYRPAHAASEDDLRVGIVVFETGAPIGGRSLSKFSQH